MAKSKVDRSTRTSDSNESEEFADQGEQEEQKQDVGYTIVPTRAKLPIPLAAQPLIEEHGNKSNAIRPLYAQGDGMSISEIAKLMGIKYQHVRNVLLQPQKRKIKEEREARNKAQDLPNHDNTTE